MFDSASTDEAVHETKKDWRECVDLRAEIKRLKTERKLFLEMASAAALLLRDLDADTFETHEAAELLHGLLQQLPSQAMAEAPYWWPNAETRPHA